jgi:hypothetical protein
MSMFLTAVEAAKPDVPNIQWLECPAQIMLYTTSIKEERPRGAAGRSGARDGILGRMGYS